MSFRRAVGVLSLALVLGLGSLARPASAQTLTAFQIERVLSLSSLSSLTTITPNPMIVTPGIVALVASGGAEVRERLIYNPTQQTVASTTFVVATGSPIPTPLAVDITQQTIAFFVIGVGAPVFSTKPGPSILFTGTVVQNQNGTPFGNYLGATAIVSAGYTTDTPPKLINVVCLIAGATVAYSATAVGTFTVTQPSTPSGPNTNAPTAVIAPVGTSIQSQIRLDASKSTDPNNLALTYSWKVLSPPFGANIINPTSATPDVQFVSGYNTYTFQVTVTNTTGLSSTGSIMILYIGR